MWSSIGNQDASLNCNVKTWGAVKSQGGTHYNAGWYTYM